MGQISLWEPPKERARLFTRPAQQYGEGLFGNAAAAERSAMSALGLSKDREVEDGAAFALALGGDDSRALNLTNDLEGRFGEDTSVRLNFVTELRALFAIHRRDFSKAVEILHVAHPSDDLGTPWSAIHGLFGALAHLQLGSALALSGDKNKAKAAYREFLTFWNDADAEIPIFTKAKTEFDKL